jgi:hypothetical protein
LEDDVPRVAEGGLLVLRVDLEEVAQLAVADDGDVAVPHSRMYQDSLGFQVETLGYGQAVINDRDVDIREVRVFRERTQPMFDEKIPIMAIRSGDDDVRFHKWLRPQKY